MIKLDQILHATDFSEPSKIALEYARTLASRFDSHLHVVHVHQSVAAAAMMSPGGVIPPHVEEDDRRQAEEMLTGTEVGEYVPSERVSRSLLLGTPFAEIIRFAREHDVDLIVLGTHGRSGLKHLIMGSVAEKVVREAPCPVLTVRPDGHQFVVP